MGGQPITIFEIRSNWTCGNPAESKRDRKTHFPGAPFGFCGRGREGGHFSDMSCTCPDYSLPHNHFEGDLKGDPTPKSWPEVAFSSKRSCIGLGY